MKKKKTLDNFAIVMVIALAAVNLLQLLWTVWLTLEQIKTGWGWGTGIEMLAIMLWLTELVCLPFLLVAVIYLILSFFRHQNRKLLLANSILFACAVAQLVVTNLFLFY